MVAIGVKIIFRSEIEGLKQLIRRSNKSNLHKAGAYVRKTAQRSIRKQLKGGKGKSKASPAGKPIRTKRGAAKRAIVYAVERARARVVIGPRGSRMGKSMGAHERGGTHRGDKFDARPTMGPALQKSLDPIARMWANSVSR